jgi:hypothetical protein
VVEGSETLNQREVAATFDNFDSGYNNRKLAEVAELADAHV